MTQAVVISAFAGSGDVYAIFAGGLVVPPEYDAILYQHGQAIGRLSPGSYNAAIVLQSLSYYDGTDSSLYWVRRGPFDLPVHLDGLPDPGELHGRLRAHLHLRFEVADPTVVIERLQRDRPQVESTSIVSLFADDIRNLLDPIVACESRENLFRPSIFHETAALTLAEYINNVLADRGLVLREVVSMSFERMETARPAALRAPEAPRPGAGVLAPPQPMGAPAPREAPAPPPRPAAPAPQARPAGGRPAAPPPRAPQPQQAPPPQPPRLPPAQPSQPRQRAVATGVDRLRRDLAEALLTAEWADFARLQDHQARCEWLRALDPQMLLSNEKISELAQRLLPEAFDFRWAWSFFLEQQVLFDPDQMRRFQQIIASISYDRRLGGGDYNQALLDTSGRARAPESSTDLSREAGRGLPPSGPAMAAPAFDAAPRASEPARARFEPQATSDGAIDDLPIADLQGGRVQASQADFEPYDLPQRAPFPDPTRQPPPGFDRRQGGGAPQPPGDDPEDYDEPRPGYRPPSYVENVVARQQEAGSPSPSSGVRERRYRSRSEAQEPAGADDLSPEELGELEVMLNVTQTLQEKKVSRWVLVLNNKSPLAFSRVKISLRAESLVTAGSGVITDFGIGTRRTIELKLARTRGIKDGSIRISAIAYAQGGTLPYVFTAQGTVSFRPSTFGNEHLVTVTPDGGGYKVLSSSDVLRVSADVAETHGSAISAGDMRLFPMRPDPKMTQQIRQQLPSAERGLCPICENETPRRYGNCQVCGVSLPRWFNKEPVLLTPEHSNARARVERARLWIETEDRDSSVFVVLGNRVSIGRRHDNDVVLRVFGSNGRVDERRTTELSRNSGSIDYSQGVARFTCLNRHGLRYRGKFVPCDSSFDLPEESRLEFINRQGEPILTLLVKIIFASGSDETGGLVGPQAVYVRQEKDSRGAGTLFLLKSVSMGFVAQTGTHRLMIPSSAHDVAARLVYHEECLWLEPERPVAVKKDRGGEMIEVQSNQLLRLDENARLDFRQTAVKVQVFHAKGMAFV